jgi:F-type H+-transporting ATPase subunit b
VKKTTTTALLIGIAAVLLAAPAALAAGGGADSYFGIPAWILKFLNLVLFVGLLVWLLKTPIAKAFRDRGNKISNDLAEARKRQEKADKLAADIQARLDSIEQQVTEILERATIEGEKQKKEIIEGAKVEAEKILASARGEVEARVKVARRQLTEYAGELAAQKAHDMLASSMNDADRRKVFAENVDHLVETGS